MRKVFHLCREHGQPPVWWDTLNSGEQALLLADLKMRGEEQRRAERASRG